MKITDLKFDYPEELVATSPVRPSRVLLAQENQIQEISLDHLIKMIPAGDVLVVNNTKVLKRRVFAGALEILFLSEEGELKSSTEGERNKWQVLFPSKKTKVGEVIELPLGVKMTLLQKGRPQIVQVSRKLEESYFDEVAELPLPPYIQKARGERHNQTQDQNWYQTAWAKKAGSFAAPTASLHFSSQDILDLKEKGVQVLEVTLHVGLGTFLPVTTEDLNDHDMHEEFFEIDPSVWRQLKQAKVDRKKIWAMGTTATRTLESASDEKLKGLTKILIQPGYRWKMVDRLLTNFHQPESTLLALVAGFSNLDHVKKVYDFAIKNKFRLFSYGDLSVWYRD